ncbi:MAG: YgfZ/GcvT domain-containing protein, partial [Pseudonocardiaceae bacterium]
IPHEVGWIGTAVHLDKGCYRGQETVARVANLGRPPRRMVLLHLESPETLPITGDPVRAGERVVGRVGTVATHYELGPIALALLKRSVDPATELHAGQSPAAMDPDSIPPRHRRASRPGSTAPTPGVISRIQRAQRGQRGPHNPAKPAECAQVPGWLT